MSEEEVYVADYASAVLPVLAWVMSNDWLETYTKHFDEFYSQLSEVSEAPVGQILGELPTPFFFKAARSVFDDFLTVQFESTPSNALDQYLDEVGMDLAEADVDFLIAFRRSFVRVYHVVSRTPYESVVLREMSGADRQVQIEDEMLTAVLTSGQKIATRIVTVNGKDYLAGSILLFDQEMLGAFEEMFELTFKEAIREAPKYLRTNPQHQTAVRQRLLREGGPVLTELWVMSVLATFENLSLANEDDPETMFQAKIPYFSELELIVECLDAHPDLERPIPREFVWVWRMPGDDPEASLKALVYLSGPDIMLESCEQRRLEEAAHSLSGLLGDAVGELTIEELERDEEDAGESDEDGTGLVPVPMSDEEESAYRERLHNFLDHQFRTILESPVTELKGRVPRELATTAKGRKQLREWLNALEAQMMATGDQVSLGDYDLGWMWKELGIEAHRQSTLFE